MIKLINFAMKKEREQRCIEEEYIDQTTIYMKVVRVKRYSKSHTLFRGMNRCENA